MESESELLCITLSFVTCFGDIDTQNSPLGKFVSLSCSRIDTLSVYWPQKGITCIAHCFMDGNCMSVKQLKQKYQLRDNNFINIYS